MVQSSPRPTPMATSTQPHDFLKISKTTLDATMHPNHDTVVIIFFFFVFEGVGTFLPNLLTYFFFNFFFSNFWHTLCSFTPSFFSFFIFF
ncbi:hypothetical protein Hanom_Chr11g01052911 [Helianthus anomalus]